jgi:hypothetical protein
MLICSKSDRRTDKLQLKGGYRTTNGRRVIVVAFNNFNDYRRTPAWQSATALGLNIPATAEPDRRSEEVMLPVHHRRIKNGHWTSVSSSPDHKTTRAV